MDIEIKQAREKIKNKCEENETYVINKLEAYIMICDTVEEVVNLYVYEKIEEKIKSGIASKEELSHICDVVFGKGSPVNSVVENMKVGDVLSKAELEEYHGIVEAYKKDKKKKM